MNDGDVLRAQRLAASVEVWIEYLSAHPLEADSAELYGRPEGWIDEYGVVHEEERVPPDPRWKPVVRARLTPEDGPYLLPYVSRTAAGSAWDGSGLTPLADEAQQRQTFYPDAARLYEEIDRFGIDPAGCGRLLSRRATFEFHRPAPSAGYRHGRSAVGLDDEGNWTEEETVAPERRGVDYFGYFPRHLRTEPDTAALVRATNMVNAVLSKPGVIGGQWLEGSPTAEESLYWFNLVLDVNVPLVGHTAQRPHGTLSADGDRNIVDGVRYLTSRVWQDDEGRDSVGVVMVVDEVIFAAREVAKTDARPGNYVATGGFGGVVGSIEGTGSPILTYRPVRRHTHSSALRLSLLPLRVRGVNHGLEVGVKIRSSAGQLDPDHFPVVSMIKYGRYVEPCCGPALLDEWLAHVTSDHPLAGIVAEGASPYGTMDPATDTRLRELAFSGYPVVKCGRGNTQGFTPRLEPWAISAGNLTATKARVLLTAALLHLGALPPASDAKCPSEQEITLTQAAVGRYQEIFDTH